MDKNKDKGSVRSLKKSSKIELNGENKRKVKKNKDKKIEKSKKEKYSTISSQTMIRDFKSTATRSLNSVRNTFDNLSNRLKLSTNGNQEVGIDGNNYNKLGSDRTPIRLYSPFGFETPSPRLDRTHLKRSCRRQMFFSPTQKIKEDVLYLNNGIKQLNLISEDIENRVSSSNSSVDSSVDLGSNSQSLI